MHTHSCNTHRLDAENQKSNKNVVMDGAKEIELEMWTGQ